MTASQHTIDDLHPIQPGVLHEHLSFEKGLGIKSGPGYMCCCLETHEELLRMLISGHFSSF